MSQDAGERILETSKSPSSSGFLWIVVVFGLCNAAPIFVAADRSLLAGAILLPWSLARALPMAYGLMFRDRPAVALPVLAGVAVGQWIVTLMVDPPLTLLLWLSVAEHDGYNFMAAIIAVAVLLWIWYGHAGSRVNASTETLVVRGLVTAVMYVALGVAPFVSVLLTRILASVF
jgi:hypothetical protein